ncbi:hypothetical protein [Zymobacter sp. IVIA_12111.31 C1]|uniref:hypothetical protein n=1 Tax=Zymobacter sp. IVIA_12111.31 C1 TaxID=3394854 RepID=UPI0039C00984
MSKQQPVYMRAVRLVDPTTGAEVSAFIPASATDASIVRERGVKIGTTLRCDMKQPRNLQFHRLAHALGRLVAQNIDDFTGKNAHDALKKLQTDSGVECDITHTDVPGFGVLVSKQPRSIAFDRMDQGRFFQLMSELCTYIAKTYWPQCTAEQIEEMALAMIQERAA